MTDSQSGSENLTGSSSPSLPVRGDSTPSLTPLDVEKGETQRQDVEKDQNDPRSKPADSTLSVHSEPASEEPPDGGLHAWLQVFYGHLAFFITWGQINSFGIFQAEYQNTLNVPPSDISWIGGVEIFLLFFLGMFSGRALDAGYFKHVYVLGCSFQVLSMLMTSLCTKYWQVIIAQGICTGIGNGLIYCPVIGLVSTYFKRRKYLAMGLTASGTVPGGILLPTIVKEALPVLGFAWSVRILALVILIISIITSLGLKTRVAPRRSGPLVDWAAFKEPTYTLVCVGMFLAFWSVFFAFFYIGSFAQNQIGFKYVDAINLIMIINAVGFPGRVIPALIADHFFGPLNMITLVVAFAGIVLFGWTGVHTRPGLYAFTAIYGAPGAAILSLWPATLSSLTDDLSKTGTRMGMAFTIVSFASLTGSPLGGALVSADAGKFFDAQMWAGASMVVGAMFLVSARICKTGWVLRAKV